MEQMQNVILNMMQAMTSAKADSSQTTKKEPCEENDFRKMMEEQRSPAEQKEPVSQKPNQKPEEKKADENVEELDEASLQELAAMQMFYMGAAQNIVVSEEQVVSDEVVEAVVLTETAVVQESGQEETSETLVDGQQNGKDLSGTEVGEIQEKPMETIQQSAETQTEAREGTVEIEKGARSVENGDKAVEEQNELPMVEGEVQVFEHVEAAPIKVSETAETTETAQTERVESQIVEKVTQAISNGETKVELQLDPEHLGKVTIEITQKTDGTLHIAVHAENGQTRGLLERDAAGLQSLLGRNGQQEVHVEVYQPQENERGNFYDGHQQQQQQEQERQEHKQRRREEPVDFLNQLRLGLVAQDE